MSGFLHFKRRNNWCSFQSGKFLVLRNGPAPETDYGPESVGGKESSTLWYCLTTHVLLLPLPRRAACRDCSVAGWSLVCWIPSKITACKDISWDKYTSLLDGQSKRKGGVGLESLEISRSYSDSLKSVALGIQALLSISCRRSSILEEALGVWWHRNHERQHPA